MVRGTSRHIDETGGGRIVVANRRGGMCLVDFPLDGRMRLSY